MGSAGTSRSKGKGRARGERAGSIGMARGGERERCGLCGKTMRLTRTECCGRWICDESGDFPTSGGGWFRLERWDALSAVLRWPARAKVASARPASRLLASLALSLVQKLRP